MKQCKCAELADKKLALYNTRLSYMFGIFQRDNNGGQMVTTLQVATVKVDPRLRGNPRAVGATFCPFCGKKVMPASATAAAAARSREQHAAGVLGHYNKLTFGALAALPIKR